MRKLSTSSIYRAYVALVALGAGTAVAASGGVSQGDITVNLAATAANPYPLFSALVVTQVVPEPAAMAILAGVGLGILLLPRRWRSFTCARLAR